MSQRLSCATCEDWLCCTIPCYGCKGRMMSADGIEIRRLTQEDPTDAVLYRGIRLEALQANPEAFGSTFEVENAKPLSWSRIGSAGFQCSARFPKRSVVPLSAFAAPKGRQRCDKVYIVATFMSPRA